METKLEYLGDFVRSLLAALAIGALVYVGAYWLDDAAWSHVLDIGSSSLWATVAGGFAFVLTFYNEFVSNDSMFD